MKKPSLVVFKYNEQLYKKQKSSIFKYATNQRNFAPSNVFFVSGGHNFTRQSGYNQTNLMRLEKVNGEHSLIMLMYNIKRSINILGVPELLAKLKKWNSPYKREVCFCVKMVYLKLFTDRFENQFKKRLLLNRTYANLQGLF